MKYYKVNSDSDNIPSSIRYTVGEKLVANELFTQMEIERAYYKSRITQQFLTSHFTVIDHPKNKTHFFCGARFQNNKI